jgi:4-amino-4-deoxy-L-arabinose transferase-like glycosyltransferase
MADIKRLNDLGLRLLRSPLAWCSLLAVAIQLAYGMPAKCVNDDSKRFLQQAEWLAAGEGYLGKEIWTFSGTGVRSETSLPPGYPVFLAATMLLTGSGDRFLLAVRIVQILMALATCYLIYFAIRPRSTKLALLAFLVLSISFSTVYTPRMIMSETLSAFVIGLLCWLISRMETRGAGALSAVTQGALCVASLLIAPATIVLACGLWCYSFWRQRRQWNNLALMTTGSLLLMVPWQIHCYRATGHIQPTVFTGINVWHSGFAQWYRTWATKRADMLVFWEPTSFHELPNCLFSSKEQRDRLTALNERAADREQFMLNHQAPDVDEAFREAAAERIAASPLRFYAGLPAVRAVTLWLHFEVWNEILQQLDRFSFTRPILEGKSLTCAVARTTIGILGVAAINIVPLVMLVILVIGGVCSIRRREILPLIVVLSALIYTALSAVSGMGELRRDFAFYPVILFILFYLAGNKPAGDRGGTHNAADRVSSAGAPR